jgi:uncharacterized membrane protein YhaH (DUF805 family)
MMTLPPLQLEPPLWAPYYGASIRTAFSRFWRKYATFSGRASRSEFWWWQLILGVFELVIEIPMLLVSFLPGRAEVVGTDVFIAALSAILLALLVPTLALIWRRLHDTNRSGAFYLMALIPVGGPFIVLAFLLSGADRV